ncbi:MAG TPA: hypothetical protein VMH81_13175 [Bryobacteraceae bacterium]|nr:hypothetical protein [Bryobacteraceae bacterium]
MLTGAYNVVDTVRPLMGAANADGGMGLMVFRRDGAYSAGLAGPSQATGYSRKHCEQMYLP